jgi:hypothetical protein
VTLEILYADESTQSDFALAVPILLVPKPDIVFFSKQRVYALHPDKPSYQYEDLALPKLKFPKFKPLFHACQSQDESKDLSLAKAQKSHLPITPYLLRL